MSESDGKVLQFDIAGMGVLWLNSAFQLFFGFFISKMRVRNLEAMKINAECINRTLLIFILISNIIVIILICKMSSVILKRFDNIAETHEMNFVIMKKEAETRDEILNQKIDMIYESTEEIQNSNVQYVLLDKAIYGWTQSALQYFERQDYEPAYKAFHKAWMYSKSNTTLQFYRIYSLYLSNESKVFNADIYRTIESELRGLKNVQFKDGELLKFRKTEMSEKVDYMIVNVQERRRQNTHD